ncbi:MAG TPA: tRNA (adenosine(37)-N6)-threonylcarbamoyltransferase complex dimerization subunit type 1 TsaB, partial [Ktedonobacterales bacterium]|nr:tRNA (adenosine(37)-N6)-threonylcarbamoyltransferase complex dimerization subunit type 1 TsaB [Ktedonobacterales bacterium]
WAVGQRHSTELLQRLDALLTTHNIAPDQLERIAVALGPGSFNGVRVALATAKSLAFALGAPLHGVPTLDVIAWGQHLAAGPVWAILEAGRGQLYAAHYPTPLSSAEGWAPEDGYLLLTPDELAERMGGAAIVCGESRPETRAVLEARVAPGVLFASSFEIRRASWLAELALARAARGLYDEPASLEPLYLRRPAITTSKRSQSQQNESQDDRPEEAAPGGEGAVRALRR